MSSYLPTIFGENMMDVFDLFDRGWNRNMHDVDRALYGRHADRLMKTDIHEKDDGYEIRVFNTIDFAQSMHYNPLAYIRKESDILEVVNVLMENTTSEKHTGDDFWPKAERLLYTALIGYLMETADPEERTIPTLLKLLAMCKAVDGDDDHESGMDVLMAELEKEKPDCLAVTSYKELKSGAAKSLQSVFLSCAGRLAPFHIQELREVLDRDDLELDLIGDRKTAFFRGSPWKVILPQTVHSLLITSLPLIPSVYKSFTLYSSSEPLSICWIGCCPTHESLNTANKIFEIYSVGFFFF